MASVAHLHRHPIKSLGYETLEAVTLTAGETMPGDRVWAVTHAATKFAADAPAWVSCGNFVIGTKVPEFLALTARLDEAAGTVTLTHPRRPAITVAPDRAEDAAALAAWLGPLVPETRAAPTGLARVPGRGMTDTDYPSVSLGSLASLRALSARMGVTLSRLRFRHNIWIEGLDPLEEQGWIGREITLGPVRLAIEEPVVRCHATSANPDSGARDTDTPAALTDWTGAPHFGIYARVLTGGRLAVGDALTRP